MAVAAAQTAAARQAGRYVWMGAVVGAGEIAWECRARSAVASGAWPNARLADLGDHSPADALAGLVQSSLFT